MSCCVKSSGLASNIDVPGLAASRTRFRHRITRCLQYSPEENKKKKNPLKCTQYSTEPRHKTLAYSYESCKHQTGQILLLVFTMFNPAVVNFRGISPVYVPALWKLHITPWVHSFLWLLSHNKLLTRDNLSKRLHLTDESCLFCCESESVHHLFFSCDISKCFWKDIAVMLEKPCVSCFEAVATWWISNNNKSTVNVVTSRFMWTIWKFRNDLYFGRMSWSGLQVIWHRLLCLLKRWRSLCPKRHLPSLDKHSRFLERKVMEAPQILPCWRRGDWSLLVRQLHKRRARAVFYLYPAAGSGCLLTFVL